MTQQFYCKSFMYYQCKLRGSHLQEDTGCLTESTGTSLDISKLTGESSHKLVGFQGFQELKKNNS